MAEEVKTPKPKKAVKQDITYYEGVGRRKTAIARVRTYIPKKGAVVMGEITHKAGAFIVNGQSLEKVFISKADQIVCRRPLLVTDSVDQYVVMVKVLGGGLSSQVGAIVHGLARALVQIPSTDLRVKLRSQGMLTRDARTRERRKVGTGGKARRIKQSPKR
jgi:small subunit ribosomal protein S9